MIKSYYDLKITGKDPKRFIHNLHKMHIEFLNIDTNEKLLVEVLDLHKFNTFTELYENIDKTLLGYKKDEIAKPSDMEKYYSKEEQERYGVVGIEIKLV